jgi:hypothetical protein
MHRLGFEENTITELIAALQGKMKQLKKYLIPSRDQR